MTKVDVVRKAMMDALKAGDKPRKEALSLLLAHYLSGPLLKGDVGVSAAAKMLQLFAPALKLAVESDCNAHATAKRPLSSGIAARA